MRSLERQVNGGGGKFGYGTSEKSIKNKAGEVIGTETVDNTSFMGDLGQYNQLVRASQAASYEFEAIKSNIDFINQSPLEVKINKFAEGAAKASTKFKAMFGGGLL